MSTELSQSGIALTRTATEPQVAAESSRGTAYSAGGLDFWLDGEVVACACPDCGAPMSVRMWLKLADCLRCHAGIELSEQIIQEIERLQKQPARQPRAAVAEAGTTAAPASRPIERAPKPAPEPKAKPVVPPRPQVEPSFSRSRVAAASQPIGVRRKIREMATVGTVRVWWHELFKDLPAWLISGVLHLAALLILAMLALEAQRKEPPYITLSTEVDRADDEGGQTSSLPTDEVDFDLPIDPNDLPKTKEAQIKMAQDARELRLDPDAPLPNAESLEVVKDAIRSSDPDRRALAVRDPRVRAEVVRQEGGTTATEAAVTRGLRWMSMHRNAEGNWSLDAFPRAGDCNGRCGGAGMRSDTAGTALVLLPFLGAGQTHLVGNYQSDVAAGLRYLISVQKEDGDLRGNSSGNSGMYAHGQATLVLCEAYKMSGDQKLQGPAQKGIDFIVKAQHLAGGWRYQPAWENPNQQPDTSVLGWQILALHSAKASYLDVPDSALQLASFYLDKAQATQTVQLDRGTRIYGKKGGLYSYIPGQGFLPSMTAEGLLCRMMMGWKLDNPGLQEGVGYLLDHHLPNVHEPDLYYWYYGTQMMHHVGGKAWVKWNARMRDVLVQLQEKSGHQAGSWPPNICRHGGQGGRLYTTAFATAILEVYYRHAPLFRQIDLE